MKASHIKRLSLLLAGLLLFGSLAACANGDGEETTDAVSGSAPAATEAETDDEIQSALDALGKLSYGGRELVILAEQQNVSEIIVTESRADVINEAMHTRNTLMEERCDAVIEVSGANRDAMPGKIRNEAAAPTGDFQLIDNSLTPTTALVCDNLLYDLKKLDMDLTGPWWDTGTADFVVQGGVYFMTGSLNFNDDHFTYLLVFNKALQKTYANTVPDPYQTVRNGDWTVDYFQSILQGISADNGDGQWNGEDTYAMASHQSCADSFFVGSGLRFVLNDASAEEPTLFLENQGQMEKALNVLEIYRQIFNENHTALVETGDNATYNAFLEDRVLFFSNVSGILENLTHDMDGDFGAVPVPKYDKAQERYLTLIGGNYASCYSVTKSIPATDATLIGDLLEYFAILSHKYLAPAYYDTLVTSRNVRDAESAEMLTMIFSHRVYDMAFYFDLGFTNLTMSAIFSDSSTFNSTYSASAKTFDRRMSKLFKKLD